MDFFDNQDNSKQNEILLDKIMEQQKKREEKYNRNKGHLANRKVGAVTNPNEKTSNQNTNPNKPVNPATSQNNKPQFVVGTGKKYSNNPKPAKASNKKFWKIMFGLFVGFILIAAVFVAVFLLNSHTLKFVCGNIEGVTIYDKNNKQIEDITLRLYKSATFRIELNPDYSNSKVQVFYNNVELEKDEQGYYTVKYSGESEEIRIMGVMENEYALTFTPYSTLKFYAKNESNWTKDISDSEVSGMLNDKIQFKIFDTDRQSFVVSPYICVYADDQLLDDNNGVYEVCYTNNITVTAYNSSPFECFTMASVIDNENVVGYEITNITEIGENTQILSLPNVYKGLPVTYKLSGFDYFPTIKELIFHDGSISNYRIFEQFNDLQCITVINDEEDSLFSQDGILYIKVAGEGGIKTTKLVKCPSGYGKTLNQGERVVNINADVICSEAFARLNYIKTVIIGANVKTIEYLAFKSENTPEIYSFIVDSNNNNFKVIDNVIYTKDGLTIVSAQFAEDEFVVADNITIAPCAFAFSKIKKLVFEGKATIQQEGLSMMEDVEAIVMPSNLQCLGNSLMLGNSSLKCIILSQTTSIVQIDEFTMLDWSNVEDIVVPDNLYDSYVTTYANSDFADLFVRASEVKV